jgi:gliding motility-associated-like protein
MKISKLIFMCLFLWFVPCVQTYATHIVGGEIGIAKLGNNLYEVRLNLLFDDINGLVGAKDDEVYVGIFEKGTNRKMDQVLLGKRQETVLSPSSEECTTANYRTRLIIYADVYEFDPNFFNSPNGYYLAHNRCCRNEVINNIFAPGAASNVFYTEIPAFNSPDFNTFNRDYNSPRYSVPKMDFACVERDYELDFSATDVDGDSLVYEFIHPLNGFTSPDQPRWNGPSDVVGGPYPLVRFLNRLTPDSAVAAIKGMKINSKTGLITVRPAFPGLYVFSVAIKEYRNGLQIGMVQRDFQLTVRDCPPIFPPVASFTFPDQQPKPVNKTRYDTLTIISEVGKNCVTLNLTDFEPGKLIRIASEAELFQDSAIITFSPKTGTISNQTDSLKITICAPVCGPDSGRVFLNKMFFTISTCNGLITDTALLAVRVLPPARVDDVKLELLTKQTESVARDSTLKFNFLGTSKKARFPLSLSVKYVEPDTTSSFIIGKFGLEPANIGINVVGADQLNVLPAQLTWNVNCEQYFDLQGRTVKLMALLNTKNECNIAIADSTPIQVVFGPLLLTDQLSRVNVFTPNGDGINESFQPLALNSHPCLGQLSSIRIFNRWGLEVYEAETYETARWTGNGYPDGLYYYLLSYKKGTIKGWVQLLR